MCACLVCWDELVLPARGEQNQFQSHDVLHQAKRGVVRLRKLLPKWSRGVRATLKLAALELICEHATRRVQNKLQKVDYILEKEETRRTSFRIYQRAHTDLWVCFGSRW